jgi:hypothetical protein
MSKEPALVVSSKLAVDELACEFLVVCMGHGAILECMLFGIGKRRHAERSPAIVVGGTKSKCVRYMWSAKVATWSKYHFDQHHLS